MCCEALLVPKSTSTLSADELRLLMDTSMAQQCLFRMEFLFTHRTRKGPWSTEMNLLMFCQASSSPESQSALFTTIGSVFLAQFNVRIQRVNVVECNFHRTKWTSFDLAVFLQRFLHCFVFARWCLLKQNLGIRYVYLFSNILCGMNQFAKTYTTLPYSWVRYEAAEQKPSFSCHTVLNQIFPWWFGPKFEK